MAIVVNGIKVSYDYEDLIEDALLLKEKFNLDEEMFVVRKTKALEDTSYRPIVDFYPSEREIDTSIHIGYMMKLKELIFELQKVDSIL